MFQFLYLLLAWSLVRGLYEMRMLLLGPPGTPGYPGAATVLGGLATVLVLVWSLGRIVAARQTTLALKERWRTHDLLGLMWSVSQLGLFAFVLLELRWADFLLRIPLGDRSILAVWGLGEMLEVLPAILIAGAAIHARYRHDRVLRPKLFRTARSHLVFNLRWLMVPLPLMIVLSIAADLVDWLRDDQLVIRKAMFVVPSLDVMLSIVPMLAALALLPWLLQLILPLRRLPDKNLDAHLHNLATRLGAPVGRILRWNTGDARVPNALVTGLTRRTRLVLISDAILDDFTPEERDAVFCHELGHVKHHHVLRLLTMMFGATMLLDAVILPMTVRLLLAGTTDVGIIGLVGGVLAIGLMLAMLLSIMLLVSPINERQADYMGQLHGPHPLAIAAALERLEHYQGGRTRNRPSPTHGSIAQRVDFLLAAATVPEVGQRAEARARRIHRVLLIASLLAASTMFWPLGVQLADSDVRGRVFDIITTVDEAPRAHRAAALRTAMHELDELAADKPNAFVGFWRGFVAETLLPWELDEDARQRTYDYAVARYRESYAQAAWPALDPLLPLQGLQRMQEIAMPRSTSTP